MIDEPTRREERSVQSGRRLRALWDGGSLLLPLPVTGSLSVGRGEGNPIQIPLASISRSHCILHLGDTIEVEDTGSSNGTELGGRRLLPRVRQTFPPGVALGVGGAILMVEIDSAENAAGVSAVDDAMVCVPGSAFANAIALADRLARGALAVLIVGETGVGKELIAERLRNGSQVAKGPFIRMNAAALPESLAESELFGHEKGAFTGATQARPGLLQLAHGGTLYLDELGELPLSLQPKLLRAVEAQEVTRVGSHTSHKISVRFISATNRHLPTEIAAGRFRADLYHRLAAATVEIPPLRARREEIEPLARQFLRLAAAGPLSWSEAALSALRTYDFPGNVRELRNIVERAILLNAGSSIEVSSLGLPSTVGGETPSSAHGPPSAAGGTDLRSQLGREEKARIEAALERCAGNQTHAAQALGISRSTLLRRMQQHDIRRE